jgi:hypothetical protein
MPPTCAGRRSDLGAVAYALVAVGLAGTLAGCSLDSDSVGAAFVDPAKFTYYHCSDLVRRAQTLVARERQLLSDMARAEQSAGGGLHSAVAYRTDYFSVRGELNLLDKTAAEKQCDLRLPAPIDSPIR